MAVIKTSFTLRLNLIDHAKIKKIAEVENRSMANMIETLVKEKIKKYEMENGEIPLRIQFFLNGNKTKGLLLGNGSFFVPCGILS